MVLGSLVVASASPAVAAEYDTSAFIQAGQGDRADHAVAIGYTHGFQPLDRVATSPWSFYGEAVVGEWFVHHPADGDRHAFTQISLSPVVRYDLSRLVDKAFIEAGIGLSVVIPRFRDHHRDFATTFNFDDHAALGYRFGEHEANEVSIRVEHFSNGGIKNPNPGQNFGQLRYARHF